MLFHSFRRVVLSRILVSSATLLLLLQLGCGPQDYQQPIQGFQDATAVVVNCTRVFLNNMNTIEQNSALDNLVFEQKPLNLPELNKITIITPEEIRVRTDALDALSQYTSTLAQLAQGKEASAVGDSTAKLSSSLKTLADDAKKLPANKGTGLDNPKLSGLLSAAATAVGAVAQLIVQQKARHEIERSVEENDAAVTELIQQISDESMGAYLRQQSLLGAYGDQLSKDYEKELRGHADPILLLGFAKVIKGYRAQQVQLAQANPSPAIDKMRKAHEALVTYAKSGKTPKTLTDLVRTVQEFVNAAQPLGQAIQALISAT